MKKQFAWMLWLLTALACSASEIVAWKVPLSCIATSGLETEGLVRRETPPETSPFFKQGDELWELKKLPLTWGSQPLSAEWVVWNATSGRIVAKGDWNQICALHDFMRPERFPIQSRLTVSLLPVVDSSRPASNDATPVAEVSLLSRSGQKSEARWSDKGNSITVEAEVIYDESMTLVEVRLFCTAKAAGQERMDINTIICCNCGESLWIARDFDGKQGHDLVISATLESFDGIPIHERVMIQNEGKTEALELRKREWDTEPIRAGDAGWMIGIWAAPALPELLSVVGKNSGEEVDPFAETAPEKRMELPKSSTIKPPAVLHPWLRHEVLDARDWFGKIDGLPQTLTDDFIGYDPITRHLFVYSSNRDTVVGFSQLFMGLDGDPRARVSVTIEGSGQTRLIALSGLKATLSRYAGRKVSRCLEIEPTIAESDEVVDLRLHFDDKTKPDRRVHSKTGVTLKTGDWSEIGAARLGDGKNSSLRVKAEVNRMPR